MPPTNLAAAAETVNIKDVQFILTALASSGQINPDWNIVATAHGIGYARNASTKFKNLMKKFDYSFEYKTLVKLDGSTNDGGGKGLTKPRPKKVDGNTTPSNSKRKREVKKEVLDNNDDDDEEDDEDSSIAAKKITKEDLKATEEVRMEDEDDADESEIA